MKLRLHSNTLRLRLSQSDVARLAESGRVEEKIEFAPGQALVYALESRPAAAVAASFDGMRIEVVVPAELAAVWMESGETGIEGSGGTVKILIEKDFVCAHGPKEENADAFPNPLM